MAGPGWSPLSYPDPPFSQNCSDYLLWWTEQGFVIAAPHPNRSNLGRTVWWHPLYMQGTLLISFLKMLPNLRFMQECQCLPERLSLLCRVSWLVGVSASTLLWGCCKPLYPVGDTSGSHELRLTDSSPKAQGWGLVSNCAATDLTLFTRLYCSLSSRAVRWGAGAGIHLQASASGMEQKHLPVENTYSQVLATSRK